MPGGGGLRHYDSAIEFATYWNPLIELYGTFAVSGRQPLKIRFSGSGHRTIISLEVLSLGGSLRKYGSQAQDTEQLLVLRCIFDLICTSVRAIDSSHCYGPQLQTHLLSTLLYRFFSISALWVVPGLYVVRRFGCRFAAALDMSKEPLPKAENSRSPEDGGELEMLVMKSQAG